MGSVYSFACAAAGTDLITGRSLSTGDRLLYTLGGLAGLGALGRVLGVAGDAMLADVRAGEELGAGARVSEDFVGPGVTFPSFRWLQVPGRAFSEDFGISRDSRLVVSTRAMTVISRHRLAYAKVETISDSPAG